MKKHLSKKRVVLAAIVVVALTIASGVAYAYFSSSGSNTGTAGVGSSDPLAVTQGPIPSDLVPGGDAQDVKVTVKNNATFKQSLSALTISLDDTLLPGGCDAGWFIVTSPTFATKVLAAGASVDLTGSIQMTESNSPQDNCKSATLHLNFVAS